jgi:hypothetical protein
MSDRHGAYIVTMEKGIKDEDSKAVLDALMLIRGVVAVTPCVEDYNTHIATERVRRELHNILWDWGRKKDVQGN